MQNQFPPRGSGVKGRREDAPSATWASPDQLGPDWDWKAGRILLGKAGTRLLGVGDDRHACTVAGTRAGKSRTVLMHNLARWPGSAFVLDPKGELAAATAGLRRAMGYNTLVIDPFGQTSLSTAHYNPFDELGFGRADHVAADAAIAADSLIVPNERDPHWTESARNLIRGTVLHLMDRDGRATIRSLRAALSGTKAELEELLTGMTDSSAFDGIVSNIGGAFLAKFVEGTREFSGILSTAQEQTAPLDDVRNVTDHSDFKLADLWKGRTTIYLVLPGMRMPTHFRWLRLMLQQALGAVERHPVPHGQTPVLFMLEEFAALGHLRSIEVAAGLLAGSGVKLWTVLQDLGQIKMQYPKSWETFLGNAGVIQAFANADPTTTEFLSRLIGMTTVVERQFTRTSQAGMSHGDLGEREQLRAVRLLEPNEITMHFARETNRQLIWVPRLPPIFMERMEPYGN
jgi:type IV secretion system protein VirD4